MHLARLSAAVLLVCSAASLAGAAPRRAAPASSRARRSHAPAVSPDVYAGFSYTHAGDASLYGWALSGSYPIRERLSIVGDLSGHYGSYAGVDFSQLVLMAGARHSWPSTALHGLTPFVEALLGPVHLTQSVDTVSSSATHFGLALGGGVDYALDERWSARGLVHLRLVHGDGGWDSDPRLSIGAVYHLR